MKIFSNYAGKDLDFDVMEKIVDGKNMILIKHDSLRDIIYNQLKLSAKGYITYNYVSTDRDHSVVECTIDDGEGRVSTELGEAVPETLDNAIANSYPTLTAAQRAFDRAAILLLGLQGKQLSNSEMCEFLDIDFEASFQKEQLETMNQDVTDLINDEDNESYFMNKPVEMPEQTTNVENNDTQVSNTGMSETDKAARLEELGQIIPLIGSNKTDTIAELYAKKPEYLRKVISIKPNRDDIRIAIENIKEYLALVES